MDQDLFNAALGMLGFNEPTREFIVSQGLNTAADLASIPYKELDDLVKHMTRTKPSPPRPDEDDDDDVEEPVMFPYLAVRKLKAFSLWMNYRILRGQAITPVDFNQIAIAVWLDRVSELQKLVDSDKAESPSPPPKFTSFSMWPEWEEMLITYLEHIRGAAAQTPIVYTIRAEAEVNDETRAAVYETLDDDLRATIVLQGEAFRIDNIRTFAIMKPLLVDGPAYPFIQRFNRTQNGREAFLSLKAQAEGQSAVATRLAKAYAEIANASFTGKGRYTFDQYVARHQKAHNEIANLEGAISETKKVADFIRGINDPTLSVGKAVVDGDNAKRVDFEVCQQYFKTLVENGKTRTATGVAGRNVSAVHSDNNKPRRPKGKAGGTARAGKPKPKIHGGHYPSEAFRALTDAEREQVKQLRGLAKEKNKRKAAAIATDDGGEQSISTVSSVTEDVTTHEETEEPIKDPAPTGVIPKDAGKQFGHPHYKRAKEAANKE